MKKIFWIGIIVLIAGGIAFAVATKPWKKAKSIIPTSTPIATISTAPEYSTITAKPTPDLHGGDKTPKEKTLEQANKFLISGLYSEAIEIAQGYRSKHPQDIKSLGILRVAYMEMQNFHEAQKVVESMITIKNTAQNKLYLLEVMLRGGKVTEAKILLSSLDRSLEKTYYGLIIAIAQEDTPAIKSLAQDLANTTDSKYKKVGENVLGVYKTYDSFRDGSPHYLRMMLANILNILEFHTIVTQFVRPTLEQYDDYRDAWILAGNAYLNLKNFRQAEEMLGKAVSLDPSHAKSPYYLGIALAEQGQIDNAIGQFNNALSNGYEPAYEVQRYIGDMYFRQKKFDDAFVHYQVVLDSDGSTIGDYAKAIYIALTEQKSPELGLKLATQAVQKFPKEAQSYALLSWGLLESNAFPQALTAIEKGRVIKDLPNFYLYAGRIYEQNNNKSQALESYKTCYEKGSNTPFAAQCATHYNLLRESLQKQ